IEIMGTEGTAILEESNLIKWEFAKEKKEDKNIQLAKLNVSQGGVSDPGDISFVGHQKQIEDMIHAIETGSNLLVDGHEGRKSVEIVEAIYKSARTGQEIKLCLVEK
ncbi:MAG TPA: Gfo/Idh/MocA family oxidoreductase, partial [Hanamia sp.]|nr:Gfo/Idh/MocA family oxidoreductase [Hanamia sp.]